jgi:hypothetical protein
MGAPPPLVAPAILPLNAASLQTRAAGVDRGSQSETQTGTPAKLFNEVAGRPQIGKAPPRTGSILPNNLTPVPRLNVPGLMKFNNATVKFHNVLWQCGARSLRGEIYNDV